MMVKDFSYWPEKVAAKMAAVPVRELQSEDGDLTGRAAFQAADGAAAIPVRGGAAKMAAVPVRELQSEGGDLTGRAAFQAADGAAAVPVRGAVFQLAEHGNNNGNNS